jgi:hypothetical protein
LLPQQLSFGTWQAMRCLLGGNLADNVGTGDRGRGWGTFYPSISGGAPRSEGSLSLTVIDVVSSHASHKQLQLSLLYDWTTMPVQCKRMCDFCMEPCIGWVAEGSWNNRKDISRVLVAELQMPALILQQQHIVARLETAYVWKHAWNDRTRVCQWR